MVYKGEELQASLDKINTEYDAEGIVNKSRDQESLLVKSRKQRSLKNKLLSVKNKKSNIQDVDKPEKLINRKLTSDCTFGIIENHGLAFLVPQNFQLLKIVLPIDEFFVIFPGTLENKKINVSNSKNKNNIFFHTKSLRAPPIC